VEILVIYGRPVIRKQQLEKEEFRLQEERPNLPAHLQNLGYLNLTQIFCSIRLIEEILLNIISKRKR
jgi:hypothetical protein